MWLRGAGFPAAQVRALGSDALVAAMDALIAADDAVQHARSAAQQACQAARAAAPDDGALRQALNRLRNGRPPVAPVGHASVDQPVEAFRAALAERDRQQRAADALIAAEHARTVGLIEALADEPRFREAVCWQNREVLHNCLDKLRSGGASERNRRIRTAIRYLQRYAVKNDTIGFFGPVGWGRIEPARDGVVFTPGPALVELRRVYFERWPIEILAEQAERDPAAFAQLRPRRRPFSWVEDARLHQPQGAPRPLTTAESFVLRHADGSLTVGELADRAAATGDAGGPDRPSVMTALEALAAERLIALSLHLPAEVLEVEAWLRAALERIPEADARARLLAPLDRLEARRDQVAAAAGDPAALDRAIGALEQEFSSATAGLSAKRGHGRMYAGRQIFFEDCRRAVTLEVGGGWLRRLAPALTMLFESARWFSWEIAQGYRRELAALHHRLAGRSGHGRVPLGALLSASRELFTGDGQVASPILVRTQQALQQRWLEVFALPDAALDRSSVTLSSAACAERARQRFMAPGPGWPRARHHSPDLMLAARSAEAAARGDGLAVLGELHVATNTLLMSHAVAMHPDRDVLVDDWVVDMGDAIVSPVQASADRASFVTPAPRELHVELGQAMSWRAREHVLQGGDLYCEQVGERVVVRSRVRALELDLIAFMDHYLSAAAAPHYRLLPRRHHWPRITLDTLVISRERWHQTKAELWDLVAPAATSYEAVVRWAKRLGLPRFVFATVPPEPKPIYVDFGSPVQVEIFVAYLRNASELGLSEMLPGHDELWLCDAQGQRYTSELRIAATDPRRWSPVAGAA
ncbi:MAG TPA: lantibiotic dehydratase [Kofleriaceae bacterium]|nr:lantibiotic dehydratase [Kofleriaceae bacterium]